MNGFSWNYGLQLHYYEKKNCSSTDSVRTDVSSKTSGVNRLSSGLAVCTRLQQTGCHGSDHYSTDIQSYSVGCLAIFLCAWIRFLQSFGNTEHNNAFKPTEKKIRSVLFMKSVDEFCFMVENDVKIQNIPFDTNGSEKI